ncbi:hypothetical protein VOLCADRAFT_98146 [Volvox carteri f. nagariensis]|uniref:Uncharacterized protein n=1 Tax=Volvox carteri f. nagariensis TaxID=3068 RepID=D8UEK2_VOLCA|nr:uncharacterized protein VOLCADRAFT_98146 [Volvox carteri f. nagariensis]EFJ41898.1 hypothetical protein VOLCADRAFT_98146 [Volvox carteri f. nagariensis]|eukprot:XP_002957096.1 hypothetical protein VOLCADRAFT_98146 [Volvox carteri f. nagariensis]
MAGPRLSERRPWALLAPELVEHIVSFLPPNFVAGTVRLINKDLAEQLKAYIGIRLSEPSPHHAFAWQWSRPDEIRALALNQRRQLLTLTARSGSLANLQIAIKVVGCSLFKDIFNAAAEGGHVEVCRWLAAVECPYDSRELCEAGARSGHVEMLRWLLQALLPGIEPRSAEFSNALWSAAAAAGHSALCEELSGVSILPDWRAVAHAAWSGHVDLTFWLLERFWSDPVLMPDERKLTILAAAAHGFDLATLKRLHHVLVVAAAATAATSTPPNRKGLSWELEWVAIPSALTGSSSDWRDKIEWLGTQGCILDNPLSIKHLEGQVEELVARPDCVTRLQWLPERTLRRERGLVAELFLAAVRRANMPLLRYLRQGRPWLPRRLPAALCEAARAGNVAVLGTLLALGWYLVNGEHSIITDVAKEAAAKGHLHVLQWLAEHHPKAFRVTYLGGVLIEAANSGSVETVEWVLQERERLQEARKMQQKLRMQTPPPCGFASAGGMMSLDRRLETEREGREGGGGGGEGGGDDGGRNGGAGCSNYYGGRGGHGGGGGGGGGSSSSSSSSGDGGEAAYLFLRSICDILEGTSELEEWRRREIFLVAVQVGKPAFLEWLANRGWKTEDMTPEAFVVAARQGDILSLRCLLGLGCEWDLDGNIFLRAVHDIVQYDDRLDRKYSGSSLEVLQWFASEGYPVDWWQALRRAEARCAALKKKDSQDEPITAAPYAIRSWIVEQMAVNGTWGEGETRPDKATRFAERMDDDDDDDCFGMNHDDDDDDEESGEWNEEEDNYDYWGNDTADEQEEEDNMAAAVGGFGEPGGFGPGFGLQLLGRGPRELVPMWAA